MTPMRFRWDVAKAASNYRKHRIRFGEATLVFRDPLHLSVQDRIVEGEVRWQTIGQVGGVTLLVVAHTFADDFTDAGPIEAIRIISARRADPAERRRYEDRDF
jgi:uncharacterized DUF497 family protein